MLESFGPNNDNNEKYVGILIRDDNGLSEL